MTDSSNKTKEQLQMVNIEQDPVNALDICLNTLNHVNYRFLTGEPVASIQSGQIKPDEKGHYIKAAVNWFKEWMDKNGHGQEFENGQLGTIIIAPSGIKSAMSHKPHPIDVQALPALPLIIEKAVVLSRTMDDMGKPLENIVVAAPIEIDAKKYYMVVRLRRHTEDKNDKPRFYTQAVTIAEDIKKGHIPSDQVTGQNKLLTQNGGRVRLLNVLYTALSVNNLANSIVTGRTNTVKTAKGTKLETVFALVEADNVIASHDSTGGVNSKFPQELQPRDRSRDTSQAWVQKTAGNLDPDSLGKTGRADTGAPIVGPDLVVESGNGRTMAIQLAYARGTADEYRTWLVEEAAYFGFKPEQVEAMNQPVLVRIRKTEVDRAAFAVEANQDDKLSFSATERAKSDARRIDDNMAMLFNPSEDGDLTAASNIKFIQAFLQSLGDTEAAQYTTTDGKPTQALVARIKAAIFSKAYNDDRLLEMVVDQAKPDLQNMLNALSVAAPKFIEAQALDRVKAEDLSSKIVDGMEQAIDKQVINAIIDAANVVMTAKNDNQDVAEFVKQQGLFGDLSEGVPELAVFLAKNSRSAKKMSLLFKAMAEYLEKQAFEQSTIGLFGDPEPVRMQDVIQYATSVIEHEYGDKANLSMFDDADIFHETLKKNLEQSDAVDRKINDLTRIFYANEWSKEKRYNGFMHDNHSDRKLRFCLSDAKDNFYIEVKDSDEGFVAEVGNCKDKSIESIIDFINEFLDEDHPVTLEKAGFDSVQPQYYTKADIYRAYYIRSPIDEQAHEAATSPLNHLNHPTEAQQIAGNYKKGVLNLYGLDIRIENPAGSIRSGTGDDGKPWQNKMAHHYGYFAGTTGADGDEVDVFVKTGCPESIASPIYVIDQVNADGEFDEHKVIIGANSEPEARQIYLSNYEAGWTGLGAIRAFNSQDFTQWLFSEKIQQQRGFDSVGNLALASFAGLDINADPMGALNTCLQVLQFTPSRYIAIDQSLDYSLDVHDQVMQALVDGTLSIEDYQQSFKRMVRDMNQLATQVEKLSKPQIFQRAGAYFEYRYKNEKKDRVTHAFLDNVMRDYNLGSMFSWSPPIGGTPADYRNAMLDKLKQGVDGTTQQQLDQYASQYQAERNERLAAREAELKGQENPQTLDDYLNVLRSKMEAGKLTLNQARMQLTPEQRQQYDLLSATKSRGERLASKENGKTEVKTAVQNTTGQIIETTHTKHGHDLFVVQLADRVDRDSYNILNAGAKKLGGYYSSFRGNGAIVGFQFKTRDAADAFLKLAGGDAADAQAQASESRDVFLDDKTQSAAERLTLMAERLQERAQEALDRPRKANTARRARMAASAELEANKDKALAQTMLNLANALKNGQAKFLDQVRQKVQVEYLAGLLTSAKWNEVQSKQGLPDSEREALRKAPASLETVDYVTFPSYTAYRSDLATLARKMMVTEGTKLLGQKLFKLVDDNSAEYEKFAKANLDKVSKFVTSGNTADYATFSSKKMASDAISRSKLDDRAIPLQVSKGQVRIVLSPSEAIQQGIWRGSDERITISNRLGYELMEKIGAKNRKGAGISLPWTFEATAEAHKRLQGMELISATELRSALREFVLLQATPEEPDQIKQLERSMVGNGKDGLDFFPTPESTVREMIQIADLKESMRVLEPSAGMGHIAELIQQEGIEPDVVEFSPARRELLELKGFNVVGQDFMEVTAGDYDRIIMNPPFSSRQDAKHVQHAYGLLKVGGRLVAIMGEGVFFGQDKAAEQFRNWLERVGGTSEKLDDGTFMDPSLPVNTGANARLVVIEK